MTPIEIIERAFNQSVRFWGHAFEAPEGVQAIIDALGAHDIAQDDRIGSDSLEAHIRAAFSQIQDVEEGAWTRAGEDIATLICERLGLAVHA